MKLFVVLTLVALPFVLLFLLICATKRADQVIKDHTVNGQLAVNVIRL